MTTTCNCGRPTAGAHLCETCKTTLRHAIVNVGHHAADLETVATKRTRYGSGAATKGSIGKTQPLPIDERFVNQPLPKDGEPAGRRSARLAPGAQLKWDTAQTLGTWVRTIHAGRPNGATTIPVGVPGMVRYLATHIDWIYAQQWVPNLLDELLDLEKRLRRMIDRPADRWYAGKCSATDHDNPDGPACTAELYATSEAGAITCRGCGTTHDIGTRRDFLLAEAQNYLVTATEAAGALLAWTDYAGSESALIDRIRNWARPRDDRGGITRLETASTTTIHGRDRALYRLGDIQALLVADAQTRQRRTLKASA